MNNEEARDPTADTGKARLTTEWRRNVDDRMLPKALSRLMTKITVLGVCGWSLVEAALEIGLSDTPSSLLAIVVAKLIAIGGGLAAFADVRAARVIFAFLCSVSVLAIAPGLPTEYTQSTAIAMVSTIECVLKSAYVITFSIASSKKAPQQSHRLAETIALHDPTRTDETIG